jgi:hypothetical protein
MYQLINKHIVHLLDEIHPARDIDPYLYLIRQLRGRRDLSDHFKEVYRRYWNMTGRQVTSRFDRNYFDELQRLRGNVGVVCTVGEVERSLRKHTRRKGQQSVQFSYATKLVHMLDLHRPVYDSNVSAFFFFRVPSTYTPQKKLQRYLQLYEFLCTEYARIIKMDLLQRSISQFKIRFPSTVPDYTDEKVIDTLIWKFVRLLNSQSVDRHFLYYK